MLSPSLGHLIDRFAELEVLVLGESMLDTYLLGQARRLSREGPVPIVNVRERRDAPGGSANTAANLATLGARARLLSVVGDDDEGRRVRVLLTELGVDTSGLLTQTGRRTLTKQRVVADNQMLVRFDQGDTDAVAPELEAALVDSLSTQVERADAIVVSDYGYGVLTPRLIHTLGRLQAHAPRVLVVDSRNLTTYADCGVTLAKPNYAEAMRLAGQRELEDSRPRLHQVAECGPRLLDSLQAQAVAVTLDVDGALLFERDRPPYRIFARPAPAAAAAGAGDTFAAAVALALAAGTDAPSAAELAGAAAAVVVAGDGTSVCGARELRAHLAGGDKMLADVAALAELAAAYRRLRRRVVFTNGCFDILHRGHISYLNRAKALGDVLVVGLNDDAGIRRLKGPGRPINTLDDRAHILAALSCVDHVVPFAEDTPEALIRALRPSLFVKGGDYARERLPEAPLVEQLGGEVQILPYVEDRSTTGLIERIRAV